MGEVKKSIEVEVPVSTAYNQWTQFEEFPQFMENVESVTQLDDTHLRWVAEIGGRKEEWQAEITHQEPDSHIAWRSTEGKENAGDVRFDSLGPERTRIQVVMTWEPEGIVEATAEKLGRDEGAVKADLERFKDLIEGRGVESGAWRGQVVEGQKID
ncbi:MAG TPA: SRPBCC family protein [Gaiellaceae bacterium]|nr:SRPBCC family protein [Gaiellaceae bacterium]